jgi:TPR repeat protein
MIKIRKKHSKPTKGEDMKRSLLAVAIAYWFVAPAYADFEEGRAAYQRGDYALALCELKHAAEKGNTDAQGFLGVMYTSGQGVPQDLGQALKWYRLAAEGGLAEAQFNLGVMYAEGQMVGQDLVTAHMWFDLAAKNFSPGAGKNFAVQSRDNLAQRMTPAQIAKAEELARKFKPRPPPKASSG